MTLRISSVANAGDLDSERLVLRARTDLKLGEYAVFSCRVKSEDKILSGDVPDAYWFQELDLKKGDFIVLYSKKGARSEKKSDTGVTSYFFYWKKDTAIWTSERRAIVVNTANWSGADDQPVAAN